MNRRLPLFILLLLEGTSVLMAQGKPVTGTAQLTLTPAASVEMGGQLLVPMTVDLSGVTGEGAGGRTPAVLAAYQIAVSFDPGKLRFDGAFGGAGAGFGGNPTSTDPSAANSAGRVTLVSDQSNSSGPTGNIQVAVLSFTAMAQGNATLAVSPVSLSTALQGDFGPAAIPSAGSTATVSITAPTGNRLTGSISASSSLVAPGTPVDLQALVSGGSAPYSYLWDFGDGSPGFSGAAVQHSWLVVGSYTVNVAITDSTSGTLRLVTTIRVSSDSSKHRRHAINKRF